MNKSTALFGWICFGMFISGCNNPAPSEATMPSIGMAGASADGSVTTGTPSAKPNASSETAGRSPASAEGGTSPTGKSVARTAAGASAPASFGAASGGHASMGGSAGGTGGSAADGGDGSAGRGGGAAGGSASASAADGGASGMAGAAGSARAGGASSDAKPPCLQKGSQVIVIGDSYLNWITHNFPDDFMTDFGSDDRMYAVGGASMASGGISGFIPDQLTQAIMDDPNIIATVMTGGGNDILIADTDKYPNSDTCKDRTDAAMVKVCQDVIADAMNAATKLMQTAADAGIKDTIYLYYPHIPGGGFGGMNPNVILEYALPMARDLCEQAEVSTHGRMRCHFLDLQPLFEGKSDWFADDGIHENGMGSAAMAKAVVKLMKEKCIAQPEASGCCAMPEN